MYSERLTNPCGWFFGCWYRDADSNNRRWTRWQRKCMRADRFRYPCPRNFCTHSAAILNHTRTQCEACCGKIFLFATWSPSEKGLFAIYISYWFQVSKESKYCLLKKMTISLSETRCFNNFPWICTLTNKPVANLNRSYFTGVALLNGRFATKSFRYVFKLTYSLIFELSSYVERASLDFGLGLHRTLIKGYFNQRLFCMMKYMHQYKLKTWKYFDFVPKINFFLVSLI